MTSYAYRYPSPLTIFRNHKQAYEWIGRNASGAVTVLAWIGSKPTADPARITKFDVQGQTWRRKGDL